LNKGDDFKKHLVISALKRGVEDRVLKKVKNHYKLEISSKAGSKRDHNDEEIVTISKKKSSAKVDAKSKGAKKGTPKKATPKKATPKKATPKKATPKKATPKKATPKKASPKSK
jgi:hypothetical protein